MKTNEQIIKEVIAVMADAWLAACDRRVIGLAMDQKSHLVLDVRENALLFGPASGDECRLFIHRAAARDAWWLMRLESIAYIFVGAFALLTLAFLVVLAPLIWTAVLHFAPGLEPLNRVITFGRFAIASLVIMLALVLAHKFLPAGRRSLRDIAPGILLTFALWIAAGIAFGSYLADFARNYVTTYAGLASVMIALGLLLLPEPLVQQLRTSRTTAAAGVRTDLQLLGRFPR